MRAAHTLRRSLLLALGISLVAVSGFAQTATFKPEVGQAGKDVVWVPTPQALVDKMLDMAKVTPQDYVIDLGSGDGRTVITAAKRGATAHGHRVQPGHGGAVAAECRHRRRDRQGDVREGGPLRERFLEGDRDHDVPAARHQPAGCGPKILDLKPGTRIVSNTFTMDDWQPDETSTVGDDCASWCTALFWIVPAKVAGNLAAAAGRAAR